MAYSVVYADGNVDVHYSVPAMIEVSFLIKLSFRPLVMRLLNHFRCKYVRIIGQNNVYQL